MSGQFFYISLYIDLIGMFSIPLPKSAIACWDANTSSTNQLHELNSQQFHWTVTCPFTMALGLCLSIVFVWTLHLNSLLHIPGLDSPWLSLRVEDKSYLKVVYNALTLIAIASAANRSWTHWYTLGTTNSLVTYAPGWQKKVSVLYWYW